MKALGNALQAFLRAIFSYGKLRSDRNAIILTHTAVKSISLQVIPSIKADYIQLISIL